MASQLGRALLRAPPWLRGLKAAAAASGRGCAGAASAPAGAAAGVGAVAVVGDGGAGVPTSAGDLIDARVDLDRLGKLRLTSSVQDRLHRSAHRPQEEVETLRQSEGWQNIRGTRLHQAVNDEQRKILRALRQSTAVLDWKGALTTLLSIPENPGPEWVPVYRSILNVCCKALRLEEAKQLFWEKLPQRDIMSYNMMLGLFGRLRLENETEDLLRHMEKDGVEKNGVTYLVAMQACQEASRWEAALSSLDELKGKPELHASTSWPAAYLAAMSACARAGKRAETRALLDEARARGSLEGNHWNTLIVSCGTDAVAAQQVFDEMQAQGFPPRLSDWKALLGTHRDIREQQRLYEEAIAALGPEVPRGEIWAVMLRTAVGQEHFDAVRWVYQRMRDHGVDPFSQEAEATPALHRALRWSHVMFSRAKRKAAAEYEATEAPRKASAYRPPPEAPAEAPLPPGWSSAVDPTSGQKYFWQNADPAGTTTWTQPTVPAAPHQASATPVGQASA